MEKDEERQESRVFDDGEAYPPGGADFDITEAQEAAQDSGHDGTHSMRPVIAFEYERYAPMLDDPSLSEDQKRAFLQALWNIIVAFVDLGFEVHPVQLACGQLREDEPQAAGRDGDLVQSEYRVLIREFVETADREAREGGEGLGA